jgi:hypothetical protein
VAVLLKIEMKKAFLLWVLLWCFHSYKAQNTGFSKVYSFNGYTSLFMDAMMYNHQILVSAYITDTNGINWDVHALLQMNEHGEIQDTIFKRLSQPYLGCKKRLIRVNDNTIIFPGAFNINAPILCVYQGDSLSFIKQFSFVNTQAFIIRDIILHSNGSFYICLSQQEMNYDVNTVIIKLNSSFEEEWKLKYGGSNYSEKPNTLTEMPDGSILIGSSKSNFAHVPILTPELYPTWLFRIDTAGQLLNQWTNPDPMSWFPGALAPTPDGGIVFAGAYTDYHSNGQARTLGYIGKLSNNYSFEWNKTLGNVAAGTFMEDLIIYDHKIYIVGTETDTTYRHEDSLSLIYQGRFGVLYCIDLDGHIFFKKYFHVPSPVRDLPGVWGPTPIIYSINIPNDSTLLMAGELRVSFSPPQPTLPTQYGWLIKTNLQGCIAPDDCDYIGIEEQPNEPLLRCWPNPATEQLSLQVDEQWLHSRFTILNLQGQTLQRGLLVAPLTIFDVQHWPPGLYIIHLLKNGKQTQVKWIKQ